jgi:Flp pilus assembly protein TadD
VIPSALAVALLVGCGPKEGRIEAGPPPVTESRDGRNQVRFEVADALLRGGNTAQALAAIRLAEEEGAPIEVIQLYRGRAMYQDGLFVEAESLLREAQRRMPRDPRPLATLGLIQADTGRTDEAIETFRQLLRLDGTDADTWNNLGFLLLTQQKYPEATEALTEAISRDGTQPRYRVNLGFALFGAGRPAEALNAFRGAGTEADAQSNLALAYELAGDDGDAVAHYQRALDVDPSHRSATEGLKRIQSPDLETP